MHFRRALPPDGLAFLGLLLIFYSESSLKIWLNGNDNYPKEFYKFAGWLLMTLVPALVVLAFVSF